MKGRKRLPERVFVPFMKGVRHHYHDGQGAVTDAAKFLIKKTRNGTKEYSCKINPDEHEWLMGIYYGQMVPRYKIIEAIQNRLEQLLEKKDGRRIPIRIRLDPQSTDEPRLIVMPQLS